MSSTLTNNDTTVTSEASNFIKKASSFSTNNTKMTSAATTFVNDEATPRNLSTTQSVKSFDYSQNGNSFNNLQQLSSNQKIGIILLINNFQVQIFTNSSLEISNHQKQSNISSVDGGSQIGQVFSQSINSQDLNSHLKFMLNGELLNASSIIFFNRVLFFFKIPSSRKFKITIQIFFIGYL